ncbi:MAG: alkaline phosphatase family protein [Nitrospinae bacterium]|nr:alkaline phosphatase family protein [Nitrospinota bacterium]
MRSKLFPRQGVLFFILALLFIFAPLSGCSKDSREKNTGHEKVQRKIFLFGLDGASWRVMDPLLKEGRLPHFAKLIENGVRANLKTLKPTHSPRIWNTMATGVLPEVHGIESFIVEVPGSRETALPSSNMRKVKALWNIFSESGYSVGVVGWWASFPAEVVNGFIISDHANYSRKKIYKDVLSLTEKGMDRPEEGEIYPPKLHGEIAGSVNMHAELDPGLIKRFADFPPDKIAEIQGIQAFSRDNKLSVLKFGLLNDESFTASGLYALKKYGPDFFTIYLNGLDAMEHHFWKYLEPEKYSIHIPEEEILLYENAIINYYIYMDEALGKFLAIYPEEETTVVVVSDHGHEANPLHGTGGEEIGYARFASGYHDNAPDGILILSGTDIKKGAHLKAASVLDITPTLLALMGLPVGEDMPGRVLVDAIGKDFLDSHAVRKIPTHSKDWKHSDKPVRSKEDDFLKSKLKALGYIQ